MNLMLNGLTNSKDTFSTQSRWFSQGGYFPPFLIFMNALFICSRNQWRSPTAETVFRRYPNVQARSAGTSPNARHTVSIDDIAWADKIFVMEQKHKSRLLAQFPRALQYKEMIVLDIPDDYRYMDEELIEILKVSVVPYLYK
ncbi:TPA: low molecular weight protein tyrosine phosphatase family protein [Neisseria subflava]